MIDLNVVQLSRLQFGLTAMFHFIFVPLTLGLSVLLGIMETIYVMTRRVIWRQMTQFWGTLFGINLAMGVATGITMEFQFGTNWAYYSHYVGDIFGVPLALEGMMAFFLEATFIGLFFFAWEKLSAIAHCTVTWLVALGSNLSALWILIANGWMAHPVGAYFDFQTMRMEISNFSEILFNPVAQAKFVHTVSAGYVTGAVFVLAISAYYLLRKRNLQLATRSIMVASAFGLAASLAVVVLGDESGYLANEMQHMKIAAIEALWKTEAPPAGLTLFGIPDQQNQTTHYAIKIPYLLGLIATRSTDQPIAGISSLVQEAQGRIQRGIKAYRALQILMQDRYDAAARRIFSQYSDDLGYALLLKRYTDHPELATFEQIQLAAQDTVPNVLPLFWSFRIMVGCGFFFIILFTVAFVLSLRRSLKPWFLKIACCALPLPWVAAELGWFISEHGRQPWVISGVLPTFLGTSSINVNTLMTSLIGFIIFYGVLSVLELYLMAKYVRLGPEYLVHRDLNEMGSK